MGVFGGPGPGGPGHGGAPEEPGGRAEATVVAAELPAGAAAQ